VGHTVVIGGGVIGLMCAYELQRRGEEVTVLERAMPGAGCSAGNAGWICPSLAGPLPAPGLTWTSLLWLLNPDSPLAISHRALPHLVPFLWRFWRKANERDYVAGLRAVSELARDTMRRFDALVADGVDFEMHAQGMMLVFAEQKKLDDTVAEVARVREYGYDAPDVLSGSQARALEPVLSDAVNGALLIARERHVAPESLCAALTARLQRVGVQILTDTEVTSVTRRNGAHVLHSGSGDYTADRCVIAAGAWSGRMAALFGTALPIEAAKGYSITFEQPTFAPRHPLYLAEAKVGCSPTHNRLRLAGTLELSGIDTRMNARRVRAIRNAAARYLKEPPAGAAEQEWAGLRPLAPDGLPVIGALPGVRNTYVATAHGMLGVTLAPSTAGALADLMLDGRSPVDLGPFDPARFMH
jgi:D-amino-acid dehydrogenase